MSDDFDVVVVGAGPAGVYAALGVIELGVNVLLIEKNGRIGFPVKCGEYYPDVSELPFLIDYFEEVSDLLRFPLKFKVNKCDSIKIFSSLENPWTINFNGVILDRAAFLESVANIAAKHGAKVMLNARVVDFSFNPSGVYIRVGEKVEFKRAEIVIGADGAFSLIARKSGLEARSVRDYAYCIQAKMDDVSVDPKVTEMHFNKNLAPGGYAWIIPKGEGVANVGLGVRFHFVDKPTTLTDYLNSFIGMDERLRHGNVISIIRAPIPVSGSLPLTFKRNVLLAGDAAGQVLPSVGSGIPLAIIAGYFAGRVAAMNVLKQAPLSLYEHYWKKYFKNSLKRSLAIRRIGDLFIKSNYLTNFIFSVLGERMLNKIMRTKLPLINRLVEL